MAIQVSGTEVISNSRVLSNVTGLKTVGGTAILGSGDIAVGGSTTADDVGTYAFLRDVANHSIKQVGTSVAGSGLRWSNADADIGTGTPSGTWRIMGYDAGSDDGHSTTLYLRLS